MTKPAPESPQPDSITPPETRPHEVNGGRISTPNSISLVTVGVSPRGIGREQVQELVRTERAQLVEVLSLAAFEALHLPDATNIPLTDLDEEKADRLDRSRPVIVYCYDYQ